MLTISFSVSGLLHGEARLLGQEGGPGRGAGCARAGTRPGEAGCSGLGCGQFALEEAPEGRGALAELLPSAVRVGAEWGPGPSQIQASRIHHRPGKLRWTDGGTGPGSPGVARRETANPDLVTPSLEGF